MLPPHIILIGRPVAMVWISVFQRSLHWWLVVSGLWHFSKVAELLRGKALWEVVRSFGVYT